MSVAARALLLAVRVYQSFFSALMPSACKFYPSCSHYAVEAIKIHGGRRGAWLAVRRIGRCHPFTRGGVDLVPDAGELEREAQGGTDFSLWGFGSKIRKTPQTEVCVTQPTKEVRS